MKRFHPSPSLVISLIALFVALGGTSYAAITSLPVNSVGTAQIKNGAVTGAKLNGSVLKYYVHAGSTLPSGKTEVGDWGSGTTSGGGGGDNARPVFTFPVPLANRIDTNHVIAVTGGVAAHCLGAGHADPGYLCVYEAISNNAGDIQDINIYNPEYSGQDGTGRNGFAILVFALSAGDWYISGTYAVTAP